MGIQPKIYAGPLQLACIAKPNHLNQPPIHQHPCQNVDLTHKTSHTSVGRVQTSSDTSYQYTYPVCSQQIQTPLRRVQDPLGYPAPHEDASLPCGLRALVPTPHKCCCLCNHVEPSLPHAVPKSVEPNKEIPSQGPSSQLYLDCHLVPKPPR